MKLTDPVPGSPLDAGKLVLSPTRTYAPVIKKILQQIGSHSINGMVHCSGGAQTKILHFVDDLHIVKDNMFEIPPLFELIQRESGTDWREMYQVFNCGHRMEIYLDESLAETVIQTALEFGVDARIIGHVEDFSGKKLTIAGPYGSFVY